MLFCNASFQAIRILYKIYFIPLYNAELYYHYRVNKSAWKVLGRDKKKESSFLSVIPTKCNLSLSIGNTKTIIWRQSKIYLKLKVKKINCYFIHYFRDSIKIKQIYIYDNHSIKIVLISVYIADIDYIGYNLQSYFTFSMFVLLFSSITDHIIVIRFNWLNKQRWIF